MTSARIVGAVALLGVPAALAPLLVRAGGRIPNGVRRMCAAIICLAPLLAPWLLVGRTSPLSVWLFAIAGGIVMLKAIDWLASPGKRTTASVSGWCSRSGPPFKLRTWPYRSRKLNGLRGSTPPHHGLGGPLFRPRTGRARVSHGHSPTGASCSTAPGKWSKSTCPPADQTSSRSGHSPWRVFASVTASAIRSWPVRSSTSGAGTTCVCTAG